MITIHKYEIDLDASVQEIQVPKLHRLLHAGLDPFNKPYIWAMVDTSSPPVARTIFVVLTGLPCEAVERYKHISTFIHLGHYIIHIFA